MSETPHDIPDASAMNLSKLGTGGIIMTNICNAARKLNRLLVAHVEEVETEKTQLESNEFELNILLLQADCHHHLQNVCISALNKQLSTYLNELLSADL